MRRKKGIWIYDFGFTIYDLRVRRASGSRNFFHYSLFILYGWWQVCNGGKEVPLLMQRKQVDEYAASVSGFAYAETSNELHAVRGEIRHGPGEIGLVGVGEIAPGGTVKLPPERR